MNIFLASYHLQREGQSGFDKLRYLLISRYRQRQLDGRTSRMIQRAMYILLEIIYY